MSEAAQPRPGQVPTLTEVIELVSPAPVRDSGLNNSPRPQAPAPGSLAAAPIITRGLASDSHVPSWSPMTTVVVPAMAEAPVGHPVTLPLADLPVLRAEVVALPELPQLNEVVPEDEATPPMQIQHVAQPHMPPPQGALPLEPHLPQAAEFGAPASQPALPEINEAQLAQRVLTDVQRQIDGMLEFRLREAMGPLLAKHSEALVRDLREELSRTMRDVVARSVTQEVAKLRQR